jgi:hypothetical protein
MLLPFKYKIPGIILIIVGLILTILFFTVNFRFEIPVVALLSSYVQTTFMTVFKTNFADELIILLLLAGFFLVAFTREKDEFADLSELRKKAVEKAVVVNTIFLFFSVLFVFGGGFLGVLIINMFLPFALYIAFFLWLKTRAKNHKS